MRRLEEKKRKEKEVEEAPVRGMEQDLSSRVEEDLPGESPEAGQEPSSEPGYWVGMNPEDSSDTDMNKSRFAVWPSEKKGEETITPASLLKSARMDRSTRETTERMARIGHELHGPDEVVLPGGTIRSSDSGAGEGRSQKAGPGSMEPGGRMQKGDEGKHSGEWRIASGKSEQARLQAEELLKKRQEHDL